MNNQQPQFTQADLLAVTGIDPGTLQNWTSNKRRIVVPASEHQGRSHDAGGRRLYSAEDVCWVFVLKYLTSWFPIGSAAYWIPFGTIRDMIRQPDLAPVALVITDVPPEDIGTLNKHAGFDLPKGSIFVETRFRTDADLSKGLARLWQTGHVAIVVPTRELIKQVMARLEALLQGENQ